MPCRLLPLSYCSWNSWLAWSWFIATSTSPSSYSEASMSMNECVLSLRYELMLLNSHWLLMSHSIASEPPVCSSVWPWPGGSNEVRARSEEHTSELQSLMRTSYAVFCLKKKKDNIHSTTHTIRHTTRP